MTPGGGKTILYLVGGFSVGGTERHLSLILPELARAGREVAVCALGADGPMSAPVRQAGISIHFAMPRHSVKLPKIRVVADLASQVLQVAGLIRRLHPAVVHCFLSEPASIGWMATVLTGWSHALVVSKRSQLIRPSAFPGDKFLERCALRRADRVLGHSSAVVEELAGHGVRRDRLGLIHNGISLPEVPTETRSRIRAQHGWSDETIVFVSLANLIPYKGHEELLAALARFDRNVTRNWALVLLGGGENAPHGQSLRRMADAAGIADKVSFVGQVGEPAPWLCAADIGILASHHEGFSNALLEYMASGLPVIATAVGGNPDAVTPGQTGWLVPPRSEEALLAALMESLDPARREMYGVAARRRYLSEFTVAHCVAKYQDFYTALTEG